MQWVKWSHLYPLRIPSQRGGGNWSSLQCRKNLLRQIKLPKRNMRVLPSQLKGIRSHQQLLRELMLCFKILRMKLMMWMPKLVTLGGCWTEMLEGKSGSLPVI